MECGMGYLVVRKTDNFESFKIDGFTIGNYNVRQMDTKHSLQ